MIDLHTHSTASDGSDEPAALMAIAASSGMSAVALTDHDTIEGLAEARAAASEVGVRLVQGCELSCEVGTATMHLLVYFLEDGPGPLQDRLSGLQAARADRNRRIVSVLQDHGLDVTLDEIAAEAGGGSVGRPHVAGVLLRKGYVSSIQEAFDVWLAKGRPAYLDRDRLLPAEAIALAHASGAVTVLAHPTSLGYEGPALEQFVAGLAADGLDGMECEYGRYTPELRAALRAMADRLDLAVTGGSDYHGRYKPDLALGSGLGDLAVPDSLLDALEARRPALN
ncbi:MAG TPA: PHP domain-containing protein [Acidimicrobiia bacterium]|nr:PHP domain-containing protein [Acidimicrobiia bacterium]